MVSNKVVKGDITIYWVQRLIKQLKRILRILCWQHLTSLCLSLIVGPQKHFYFYCSSYRASKYRKNSTGRGIMEEIVLNQISLFMCHETHELSFTDMKSQIVKLFEFDRLSNSSRRKCKKPFFGGDQIWILYQNESGEVKIEVLKLVGAIRSHKIDFRELGQRWEFSCDGKFDKCLALSRLWHLSFMDSPSKWSRGGLCQWDSNTVETLVILNMIWNTFLEITKANGKRILNVAVVRG